MEELEILISNNQNIKIKESLIIEIKRAIKESLLEDKQELNYQVSLSFVDNKEIREINRIYRNKDLETDVLSFPLITEQFDFPGPKILGDIVISVEKALEQSYEFGHSLEREILYLTVHSMFHLLGYDHMKYDDKLVMRELEERVMKKLDY